MVHCERVLQAVRDLCPPRFALEGDPTGLQVGHAAREVERVLCTLDLTLAVAEEARDLGAGLVVSHHAVVFRPLSALRTDTPQGRILATLVRADVAVYVCHTALDVAPDGMNDHLARTVGLTDVTWLQSTGQDDAVLLSVAATDVAWLDPVGRAASSLHDDLAAARKALGAEAVVEPVTGRVEVVVPAHRVAAASRKLERALGRAPRAVPLTQGTARGIGRVGRLARPEPLRALAARLKDALAAPAVRAVAADLDAPVEKVAVLGGDGRRYVDAAAFAGADVLVTGDVDHHTALEARARGLALLDVGHWASEKQAVEVLVSGLRERLRDERVEVLPSRVVTQPFAYL